MSLTIREYHMTSNLGLELPSHCRFWKRTLTSICHLFKVTDHYTPIASFFHGLQKCVARSIHVIITGGSTATRSIRLSTSHTSVDSYDTVTLPWQLISARYGTICVIPETWASIVQESTRRSSWGHIPFRQTHLKSQRLRVLQLAGDIS